MIRTLSVLLMLTTAPAFAGEIWVSNEKDNSISVIDEETLEVIPTSICATTLRVSTSTTVVIASSSLAT